MGQEYFINSQELQDKVSSLLPSQGGAGAGFDLSASTQIIPVIDLTESAEGSNLPAYLQSAQDFATQQNAINNATNTVLITTTGFFKLVVNVVRDNSNGSNGVELNIFDGTTSKPILSIDALSNGTGTTVNTLETIVYLRAGDSLRGTCGSGAKLQVFSRQVASIDGILTNPLGF